MRKILKFPKLDAREVCSVAMLIAITVILAVFATFRIGDFIKIPFKFISVFITAAFYGPWLGGLCGAAGDIINTILVPSGAPLPGLTALEFLCGFVYGVLFYGQKVRTKAYIFKSVLCAIIMFFIDMFLSTAVLLGAGYFPDFSVAFYLRLPAGIIKAAIQLGFLLGGYQYLEVIRNFGRVKK